MKIKKIKMITGELELLTGTKIGGSSDTIEIGGNDNPVIRNPLTQELYIPGSSLKGKMRMFAEWTEGKINKEGHVHSCEEKECPICRVFGRGANDSGKAKSGPTRISVKDAYLTKESKEELKKLKERVGNDTELKYENNINRLTSAATPRNSERIPAGVKFEFSIGYKIIDLDDEGKTDEAHLDRIVFTALKGLLLEGIGGGVSRGNGQIKFTKLEMDGEDCLKKLDEIKIG
ncbi:type III-A CRISPR-associated RAMP protein Csm3 [Fusobacterium sp. PH5-44]|uniref:type III-A CRISPR-associated RAMP protein Csm3 n=1 Tax=unclassified Fusobacterium TaxID=2648384 RepID=UPI003D21BA33